MATTHMSEISSPEKQRPAPTLDAFFSYGFRPFFLGGAVFSAAFMTVWLAWVLTVMASGWHDWLPIAGSPFAWHAHEMVFGFAAAAIAGFLLTAVPNWTGALPLSGPPLIVLFLTWVAGRAAMMVSGVLPFALAATIDAAFLPLLGAFAAQQLFVKPHPRNLVFLLILALLTIVNVLYHLATAGSIGIDPLMPLRLSLILVGLMTTIIGGRIIPAFTHNWLHLNGVPGPMPRRIAWLDVASVLSVALFAASFAAGAPSVLQGLVAAGAAALNGARLSLWRGLATRREPIVWILHLGYAWVVFALALAAASALTSVVPESLAFHALGTGAVGTMILAVMTRASLGHTGRMLKAPPAIVWAYVLVTVAALMRVMGPLFYPAAANAFLLAAALAWIATFVLFAAVYAPILTTPRVHMRRERS